MRVPVCDCGQLSQPGKLQGSNGTWMWGYYCADCPRWLTYRGRVWQPHDGADLDVIDVIQWAEERTCEWCGEEEFCENHHYWPREFFSADADKGPTGWLCVECHDLWHRKVTGRSIRKPKQTDTASSRSAERLTPTLSGVSLERSLAGRRGST